MAWMIPFMSRPPQDALPDMKESRSVTRQHSDLRPRLLLGGGNLLPRTAGLNGLRVMRRCVDAASRSSHCGDVMMSDYACARESRPTISTSIYTDTTTQTWELICWLR